mgnify:CR=1 FL=1
MSQTFDKKVKRRQYAHNNSISDNMGLQALNKKDGAVTPSLQY